MDILLTHKKLFNYFNLYRVMIGLIMFGVTFLQSEYQQDFRHPQIHQLLALFYLLFNCGIYFYYRTYSNLKSSRIFISVCSDVLLLHLIFYVGVGVEGGLGNLVVISVAAGNIMLLARQGLALAALATLLSLGIEIERYLNLLSAVGDIGSAGLMGGFYFAGAFIVQSLSQRIRQSETLALQQQQDIFELQQLNHQIIQSMRTGIIVCNLDYSIRTMNHACEDLIGLTHHSELPSCLSVRIDLWLAQPGLRTTPFKADANFPLVQANFSMLGHGQGEQILIFIEDTRHLTQQAQQLKLASLGRLTASIAHEVRNPLGAISHATQLLNESTSLDAGDQKMLDIIARHCARMNRIIEDTLSLSRRAEPMAEEVELTAWLCRFVQEYENQHDGLSIDLHHPKEACLARFDQGQIEQVLVNLLDNGARHGKPGAENKVLTVSLAKSETSEQAIIDVINDGGPIPDDVKKHLFEPFFTTASQGTGLGLYLAKEICEANQAQLDYIEQETEQVCFRILFAPPKRII